jgi:RNA polymerase-binding transcription factor DksA
MQPASPRITTLDASRLEEFEQTLRAMLSDRVPPLCNDEQSLARHQAHAQSLVDALERIGDGTFGRCRWCGGSIPCERLEVVPTALGCRTCSAQQR